MQSEHGFSAEHVQALLDQAVHQDNIIKAISRPAERVKPWHEYRAIFITDQRIERRNFSHNVSSLAPKSPFLPALA